MWRSAFAEMFDARDGRAGGFDIVIANPPYHQLERDGGRLANLYRQAGYRTLVPRGDIYQLFYERGCEVLKPETGILAYITSNSWLRAEYGKSLRRFFAERHTPLKLARPWARMSSRARSSTAGCCYCARAARTPKTQTTIPMNQNRSSAIEGFPAVDMDRLSSSRLPAPDECLWGRVRPEDEAPWEHPLTGTEQSSDGRRCGLLACHSWTGACRSTTASRPGITTHSSSTKRPRTR